MYLRDDIFFCPGCCQFHNSDNHEPVEVPGMDYFHDLDTGKRYKIKKPKLKSKKSSKGFGNINL
jgi:hypothetical protein